MEEKTVIIGSGSNAVEAYFALQSEEMLGFDVVAFYDEESSETMLQGLPVLHNPNILWEMKKTGDIHFIVAFEMENSDKTMNWLRELSKKTVVP